ncbi:LOG family protein [Agrobacterium pusense]|uniref:LOG family protein n=1 Tax=Agrobacterium pusense TaxID=648995 RepID=UPI00087ED87B|nr:TIGR00730 family Rossman fold protein [Agrobacterium pusense]TGR69894.1 TIGR00730 family Rossman fold protein [bacterium M00.F.Ca.ET.194.01.1.1]TGS54892.1 TIGR00730 family Rossman fold protein [bacterium M00.F.Ca.ET.179.01.1.1]TGV47768.1 TIGR00730 family Rossman fold protein [bacterium M00.F.Ca.ET.168.01.1.1]MBN8933558.1 TIGR00730 family Rossman fold protein [Agrobacterium pusense]MBW9059106.1 TIGR00730 family Rossman fold protein [Agrobacterium pusense]
MTRPKNGKLRRKDGVWDPLKRSAVDKQQAEVVVKTPQSDSPSYRLAYVDTDFLCREELRPVRLQLELLKTEMALTERGINSTVVMFGGARIPEPGGEAWAARNETQKRNLEQSSVYYDEARKFARLCTDYGAKSGHLEYVVVTGGGPGVMEAGNRGAMDAGGPSIGLNIVLPHEQAPNPYVTPELSFNFHYFAIRKMHFLMRAKAVVVFPGGFGTLDELFEALTLIQTKRMAPIPLILFGEKFWRSVVNFEFLADFGTIAPEDMNLLHFAETADDAWKIISDYYEH